MVNKHPYRRNNNANHGAFIAMRKWFTVVLQSYKLFRNRQLASLSSCFYFFLTKMGLHQNAAIACFLCAS
jgi:hypothetical protein